MTFPEAVTIVLGALALLAVLGWMGCRLFGWGFEEAMTYIVMFCLFLCLVGVLAVGLQGSYNLSHPKSPAEQTK